MLVLREIRPAVRTYLAVVLTCGALTVAHSFHQLYTHPVGVQLSILVVLTILTGSFSVKVSSINAYISVSETFVIASVLLFGTAAGTVAVFLECLVIVLWMKPENRLAHRVFFNMAAPAVAIWISGTAFFAFSEIAPYNQVATPLPQLFLPLLAFTSLYFLLNSWLVAIAVGLETNKRAVDLWWQNFAWLSLNYFSGASVAALIVTYTRELDLSTLAIIIPILVVSYLTFRSAMGRAEDSYNHLAELNRLYLSTIETLAMAIDAKDQITHGHIRRVQSYAVELAKRVGIRDDKLLKAIEAAALLHDMGKLAVPEYILNKPGRLTPAEFDKMKLHASVGADILSAIDFPYPVVPIVRHHHENWDGTGYPDGIKGTDIPVGARILSVVDCFDALTSDRPYRPRLSDADAVQILLERRGSMYDPLIVDTFIRVHHEIEPAKHRTTSAPQALREIKSLASTPDLGRAATSFDEIAASSTEMLALYDLSRELSGQTSVTDTGEVIAKHLRRLVPFSLSVLYVYDDKYDVLTARHASGELAPFACDLQIGLGTRVSGWVAANRQTIANSDPVLDLGEVAKSGTQRLRSCLSTALISNGKLVGVLSLYSTSERFSDDNRRVVEAVGKHIAHSFCFAAELDTTLAIDSLTGLPTAIQLHHFLDAIEPRTLESSPVMLLRIEIVNMKALIAQQGRSGSDEIRRSVGCQLQECLRIGDRLFRSGADEFVAVISGTASDATDFALRIREIVRQRPFTLYNAVPLRVDVDIHFIAIPSGTTSVREFVAAQLSMASPRTDGQGRHIH
jgi:diguanylate cyclase (GGDEF)-like protein/putative nucleotidyltransferase with HDIG domain